MRPMAGRRKDRQHGRKQNTARRTGWFEETESDRDGTPRHSRRDTCKTCYQRRSMQCKFCRQCNSRCPDCLEDRCARLESSPFVCNGCEVRNRCALHKRLFRNDLAMENYREVLVESRRGANVTETELLRFDESLYRCSARTPGLRTSSTSSASPRTTSSSSRRSSALSRR